MSRKKIEMILLIHEASVKGLYSVLDGITAEQYDWKPAPESRSVKEMSRHLIRVDNSFLKKLNQKPEVMDPVDASPADMLNSLKEVHLQISKLVADCDDDSDLFIISKAPDASESDTINEHILHSCQHNLYHLAQMIYLRRAQDRTWKSPIENWDETTRIIARYLSS